MSSSKRIKKKNPTDEPSLLGIKVPKDPHPYLEECFVENMEVYCTGNYKLTYLNLASNNISCNGIKAIKGVLKQQRVSKTVANKCNSGLRGISKLRLECNFIKPCQLLSEVAELLEDEEKLRTENNRAQSAMEFRRNSRKSATIAGV